MEFLPEGIEEYARAHSENEPEYLKELTRETWQKVLVPRMLSGHLQGRVLSFLSTLVRPARILEVGTYTGYSAICLAEGLADGGIIHTIDINDELGEMHEKYFAKAGITDSVKVHFGHALDVIPSLKEQWDLVFIDADKENYPAYYEAVIDQIRPGGMLIFDNVLWSGKVVEKAHKSDEETLALQRVNRIVQQDSRVRNLLLPIRDGLMIAVRV
jgi:caffeoyl-CoA O-methyltransferase